MKATKKIRVAVLYGGRSPEHEVSLASAANVMQHLDRSLFEVVPIKIDKQGSWFLEGKSAAALPASPDYLAAEPQKLFTPAWLKGRDIKHETEPSTFSQQVKTERLFDVIFPMMHGTFSEDGTIQGLLELADVPYVGCGVLASAIGMDKDISRRLISHAGMPTVSYLAVKHEQWKLDPSCIEAQVTKMFTLPLFVKPANQGSSIGVYKVKKQEELVTAINKAFHYDTKILIEQGIAATELELCLLESLADGEPPFVSVAAEARPNDEFYTYKAKYTEGGMDLLIPPPTVSAEVQETVRKLSQRIFTALGAEGMARIDFFIDKNTQAIYFNELNSIPGFTLYSAYPRIMTASGLSYPDVLTRLVMLAIKRFEQKQNLERSYVV